MIYVICGLIGSGKTTYAKSNFQRFTDLDEISSKQAQLKLTHQLHTSGETVAHITCFPTSEELAYFNSLPTEQVKYIWIATSEIQCRKNILHRKCKRDIESLQQTMSKNRELASKIKHTTIPFELVDVFHIESERW